MYSVGSGYFPMLMWFMRSSRNAGMAGKEKGYQAGAQKELDVVYSEMAEKGTGEEKSVNKVTIKGEKTWQV
jgi:hypothetical protein